jgi:hypothetical protein
MISKLPVAFVLYPLRRRRRRRSKRTRTTRTRGSRRTEKVEKWLFQKGSRKLAPRGIMPILALKPQNKFRRTMCLRDIEVIRT